MLAGISSDYYLRLEQGRDSHPSAQVLDALARALQLDVKASEYLHQLASPSSGRRDPAGIDAADGVRRVSSISSDGRQRGLRDIRGRRLWKCR